MKFDLASAPFAVTLASGVLLPSWMPRRRLVTFAANSAACAYNLTTAQSPVFAITVTDTHSLTKAQEKQLSVAMTALCVSLLSMPLVGLARRSPIPRLAAAAGAAIGVVVLNSKTSAWMARRTPAEHKKSPVIPTTDPAQAA